MEWIIAINVVAVIVLCALVYSMGRDMADLANAAEALPRPAVEVREYTVAFNVSDDMPPDLVRQRAAELIGNDLSALVSIRPDGREDGVAHYEAVLQAAVIPPRNAGLLDVFARIESPAFEIEAGVISGFAHFNRWLTGHPAVRQLVESVNTAADVVTVVERAEDLLSEDPHSSYANPNDAALAAYLYVLAVTDRPWAWMLARRLDGPAYFWSARLAQQVVTSP